MPDRATMCRWCWNLMIHDIEFWCRARPRASVVRCAVGGRERRGPIDYVNASLGFDKRVGGQPGRPSKMAHRKIRKASAPTPGQGLVETISSTRQHSIFIAAHHETVSATTAIPLPPNDGFIRRGEHAPRSNPSIASWEHFPAMRARLRDSAGMASRLQALLLANLIEQGRRSALASA